MSSGYVWKLGIDICSCFIPDGVAEHVAKIAGARTGALDNKRNALPALADGLEKDILKSRDFPRLAF